MIGISILLRAGQGFKRDERFTAALRIDPMLVNWLETAPLLARWGYRVTTELNERTLAEARRFLADWARRIDAQYVMVSLPPTFEYPSDNYCSLLIERV